MVEQTLRNHQNLLNSRYENTVPDHRNLLKSIFKLIFATSMKEDELCNCQKWTTIGFQNRDPSTDLRSLGVLGLTTLEYHCKYHTTSVKNHFIHRDYPYACTSFAIVNFMVQQMTMRNITTAPVETPMILLMKKELYFNGETLETMDLFERLFCILFECFDKLWVKQQATYMDFNIVYDTFAKQVTTLLKKEPANFR